MHKNLLFIEKKAWNLEETQEILKKFPNAKRIPISSYKDILNPSGGDWMFQKRNQVLVLAKREGEFYYDGSSFTPTFGFEHFYYNTLAINCLFDCNYCYLQGMFPNPHLVLFVNNRNYLEKTQQLLEEKKQPVYLALSYDTDLLALEKFYPYCKEWIAFTTQNPLLTIEIRTKSTSVETFLEFPPSERVVPSFTLAPQRVIDVHEPMTPSLDSRIKAIKKLTDRGWKVRICLDPVIAVDDWKYHYQVLVNKLKQSISVDAIREFSVGVFRMNKKYLQNIRKQRPEAGVLFSPHLVANKDMVEMKPSMKNEILEFVQEILHDHFPHVPIEAV